MKNSFVLSLGLVVALATGVAVAGDAADELKSGPQCGDGIGAFNVTKIAGAEDDGVPIGENLCYRCRNGNRPQVMIFTRSTNKKVTDLIKQLDEAVAKNSSSELRVFVSLLGDDKEQLSEKAKKFAAKSKTKNVPFVVPNEFENGPDNYGINAKADVTITLASDSNVKATHAFAKAKDVDAAVIIADLGKILN